MQRRAAAIYFVFFLVIGAGAYGLIQTSEEPTVTMEGDAYTEGDSVTLGDREFTVASAGGGSGELTWVNESAVITNTIDNGSEVPVTDVRWEDQTARMERTFEGGSTVTYNGSEYDVSVNESAEAFTLTQADDASVNESYAVGDTLPYQGREATVTSVESGSATIVAGGPYMLLVQTENVTNPTEATFVEQRDVESLAQADPALYDETIVQDGTRMVTYRANNTNVPVEEYFPPIERHTIAEGETLAYQGNESTVDAVENESVELTRPGEQTNSVDLTEGGNFTVGDQQYFAHFPDDSSVLVMETDERYDEYRAQENEVDSYSERMNGLWGIAELSFLAAIILVATAFLPVRG